MSAPRWAIFFIAAQTQTQRGKRRQLRSCLGILTLTAEQAQRLNLSPRTRLSPLLEKCCLLLSANESFQRAEQDLAQLTGVKVGHTTQQKLVHRQELMLPEAHQPIHELSADGGKVRLRPQTHPSQPQRGSGYWRDYKAMRVQGIYYGARLDDPWTLSDWVNSQPCETPLVCLGDGHPGIWNLFESMASAEQRCEILDWYHLKENLYKIRKPKAQLERIEGYLWAGQVPEALQELKRWRSAQAQNFRAYLERHRNRIVSYSYYQAEQLCSVGSGAVESAIKQIGRRVSLSGAQWLPESVNGILNVRCAYLNGAFS